jgi:hypothetical protein
MIYSKFITERISESFLVMRKNFKELFLPVSIFYIWVFYVFKYLLIFIIGWFDMKNFLWSWNLQIIILWCCLCILYITLEIWVILWLYKTLQDIDTNKEIDLKANYNYGFSHIWQAFQIYYYIFMYIYFIPSILFIISGLYFIYIQQANIMAWVFSGLSNQEFFSLMTGLTLLWIVPLILFSIYVTYKSNRTVFSLISALDSNDYTRENFNKSLDLTTWNWWRIFWNFLLIAIIIMFVSRSINMVFLLFWFGEVWNIFQNMKDFNIEAITQVIKDYTFWVTVIIKDVIWRIIMILGLVFSSVFTFIFYKSLQSEALHQNESEIIEEVL